MKTTSIGLIGSGFMGKASRVGLPQRQRGVSHTGAALCWDRGARFSDGGCGEPMVGPEFREGYEVQKTIDAVLRSARERGWVAVLNSNGLHLNTETQRNTEKCKIMSDTEGVVVALEC